MKAGAELPTIAEEDEMQGVEATGGDESEKALEHDGKEVQDVEMTPAPQQSATPGIIDEAANGELTEHDNKSEARLSNASPAVRNGSSPLSSFLEDPSLVQEEPKTAPSTSALKDPASGRRPSSSPVKRNVEDSPTPKSKNTLKRPSTHQQEKSRKRPRASTPRRASQHNENLLRFKANVAAGRSDDGDDGDGGAGSIGSNITVAPPPGRKRRVDLFKKKNGFAGMARVEQTPGGEAATRDLLRMVGRREKMSAAKGKRERGEIMDGLGRARGREDSKVGLGRKSVPALEEESDGGEDDSDGEDADADVRENMRRVQEEMNVEAHKLQVQKRHRDLQRKEAEREAGEEIYNGTESEEGEDFGEGIDESVDDVVVVDDGVEIKGEEDDDDDMDDDGTGSGYVTAAAATGVEVQRKGPTPEASDSD